MSRVRERAPDLCPTCGASWDCDHGTRKPVKAAPDEADRIAAEIKAGAEAIPYRHVTWREHADQVLARLFDNGNFTPSPKEIFDAYPFGMRKYTPYKIWLEEVKWWKAGCPDKRRKLKVIIPLPGQAPLLKYPSADRRTTAVQV